MELQLCGVTIQPHAMFRKTLLVSFDLILPCSSLEANLNLLSYHITSHLTMLQQPHVQADVAGP